MAIYDAAVVEFASISAIRDIGGGFSTGAFSSGAYDNLGSIFATAAGDFFTSSIVVSSSVAETSTGSDAFAPARFSFALIEEFVTGSEDGFSGIGTFNSDVQEEALGADSSRAAIRFVGAVDESAVTEENLALTVGFRGIISESATGSDAVVRELAITVSETVRIVSTRNIGGGFSTGSFSSGAFDNLGSIFADASGEFFNTQIIVDSELSEAITISDEVFTNADVIIGISDLVRIADSVVGLPEYPAEIDESAQVSLTSLGSTVDFVADVSESSIAADDISTITEYFVPVEEIVFAEEIVNTIANMTFGVAEIVIAIDTTPTNAVYNIPLAESVLLSDQVNARLLWEPVDTSETTDWNLIDTVN